MTVRIIHGRDSFLVRLSANGEAPRTTDHGHEHGVARRIILKKKLWVFNFSEEMKKGTYYWESCAMEMGGPCHLC